MKHNIITKELKIDVGEAFWRIRREKKLKQIKVAEAVECGVSKLDDIEMGRQFDYNLFRKLAKYYGVNMKIVFE